MHRLWILVSIGVVAGCGDSAVERLRPDGGRGDEPQTGEATYATPLRDGNSFACATCHALDEPAGDGFRRAGHPIGDAANRPHFKNGQLDSLLDAVNVCVVEWMSALPLRESDPRWQRLSSFLRERAGDQAASPLTLSIVPPPDALDGDRDAGEALFERSCALCHGAGGVGTERAPPLVGGEFEAAYVARRVRTSGAIDSRVYRGLSDGRMPFWAADRLSDDELRDVVAHVVELGGRRPVATTMLDAGAPDGRNCASTHPRVGQIAELATRFHGVRGTARIVDDCTIDVDGFHYDGRGIDVRFYAALDGDFRRGFAISGDLLRSTPYRDETLRLSLPAGRTLDELDSVSVWCVDAAVNFGEGTFRAP